ncbi:hypothetical protein B0187_08235 [Haemophilus paracuniculus]|uniref:Uncharacterized protein n=1 Tax=Haemophilus paracuniculus TaxID=734 RepID=A0A1T0AQG1_9PAST|nr:hypothetical protein [Haemophilus paracuniculus]OOR98425.1 hypothetical protein B0187_08235 [Haemophilus paracuniculus]
MTAKYTVIRVNSIIETQHCYAELVEVCARWQYTISPLSNPLQFCLSRQIVFPTQHTLYDNEFFLGKEERFLNALFWKHSLKVKVGDVQIVERQPFSVPAGMTHYSTPKLITAYINNPYDEE